MNITLSNVAITVMSVNALLDIGWLHIYIYVRVKSLPPVLYGKKSTRHEAEMANIARGEAECYISIEAECRVLYFSV